MKFSNKLSFTIFAAGFIVLILFSFAIYKFNYASAVVSQSAYTKSIAQKVSYNINQILFEKIKTALTLANCNTIVEALEESLTSYADLPDEKRKELIIHLNEKWKSTKDSTSKFILTFTNNKTAQFLKKQQALLKGEYGEIFLTNKFGALVASTSRLSTFAHGDKYWWVGSYNNGKGWVFLDDRGYDDSVGGYVLGLVLPVRKGTQVIGILKCNLNILGGVSELITGATDKLIGKFKLVRSGGMVIFEEGCEPLSTQVHDDIFKQLKNNNKETIIINDSGEKYIVAFSEIKLTKNEKGYGFGGTFESIDHKKGNRGESWYVLCYRQMSIIQAPTIELIKLVLWVGFVIIFILLIVSYLFGKKIAQPLGILNQAAEKIGEINFDYRVDMRRNDEFGTLAHTFNKMAGKLQRTTTSIELLRRSEANHRILLENIPQKIFYKDRNSIYILCNQHYANGLNIVPEDIVGKSDYHFYPKEFADKYRADDKRFMESGKTEESEKKYIVAGQEFWVHTIKVPIKDSDRAAIGILCISWDITKRKQGEEEIHKLNTELEVHVKQRTAQLEASNKELKSFSYSVSHDLRAPLRSIDGFSQALLEDYKGKLDEEGKDFLNRIRSGTKQMGHLIDDLLKLSRLARVEMQFETINLSRLAGKIFKEIIHKEPEREVKLTITPDLTARGDPGLLRVALENLLKNAWKFTSKKKNTKIDVGIKNEGGERVYFIRDNGAGFDMVYANKLFGAFQRLHKVIDFPGTGIGLATVQQIIHRHGGRIWAEGKVDKGATFYFTL